MHKPSQLDLMAAGLSVLASCDHMLPAFHDTERHAPIPRGQIVAWGKVTPRNKLGRNEPCHCGSGKKFKKCHYPALPEAEQVVPTSNIDTKDTECQNNSTEQ